MSKAYSNYKQEVGDRRVAINEHGEAWARLEELASNSAWARLEELAEAAALMLTASGEATPNLAMHDSAEHEDYWPVMKHMDSFTGTAYKYMRDGDDAMATYVLFNLMQRRLCNKASITVGGALLDTKEHINSPETQERTLRAYSNYKEGKV